MSPRVSLRCEPQPRHLRELCGQNVTHRPRGRDTPALSLVAEMAVCVTQKKAMRSLHSQRVRPYHGTTPRLSQDVAGRTLQESMVHRGTRP
jgi:hypothetical protein